MNEKPTKDFFKLLREIAPSIFEEKEKKDEGERLRIARELKYSREERRRIADAFSKAIPEAERELEAAHKIYLDALKKRGDLIAVHSAENHRLTTAINAAEAQLYELAPPDLIEHLKTLEDEFQEARRLSGNIAKTEMERIQRQIKSIRNSIWPN